MRSASPARAGCAPAPAPPSPARNPAAAIRNSAMVRCPADHSRQQSFLGTRAAPPPADRHRGNEDERVVVHPSRSARCRAATLISVVNVLRAGPAAGATGYRTNPGATAAADRARGGRHRFRRSPTGAETGGRVRPGRRRAPGRCPAAAGAGCRPRAANRHDRRHKIDRTAAGKNRPEETEPHRTSRYGSRDCRQMRGLGRRRSPGRPSDRLASRGHAMPAAVEFAGIGSRQQPAP